MSTQRMAAVPLQIHSQGHGPRPWSWSTATDAKCRPWARRVLFTVFGSQRGWPSSGWPRIGGKLRIRVQEVNPALPHCGLLLSEYGQIPPFQPAPASSFWRVPCLGVGLKRVQRAATGCGLPPETKKIPWCVSHDSATRRWWPLPLTSAMGSMCGCRRRGFQQRQWQVVFTCG